MELADVISEGDVAKLKQLAGQISAAEIPGLELLDEISALAAGIASRYREAIQHHMIDKVMAAALVIVPAKGDDDVRLRLAHVSLDELEALTTLADETIAAHAALRAADTDLMA